MIETNRDVERGGLAGSNYHMAAGVEWTRGSLAATSLRMLAAQKPKRCHIHGPSRKNLTGVSLGLGATTNDSQTAMRLLLLILITIIGVVFGGVPGIRHHLALNTVLDSHPRSRTNKRESPAAAPVHCLCYPVPFFAPSSSCFSSPLVQPEKERLQICYCCGH